MAMKILVTGGAGFIGSNLVEKLVEEGNDVFVVDSLHTGSRENLKSVLEKIEFIRADCKDIFLLNIPKVDFIFHLGIFSSSPMYKQNPALVGDAINGAIAVFEFAKKNSAGVVFASSSSIYSGLPTPHKEEMTPLVKDYYTEARYCIERLAKLYSVLHNVNSTALRFFSVYGKHEEYKGRYANCLTQMILNDEFVIYGDGSQTRDFIHVSDVVNACITAMNKSSGFKVYNVGTGRETSFNEVAKLIQKYKPLKITYKPNPIKNYVDRTCADITLIKNELGWKPTIELEDGIKDSIKYYLHQCTD